MATTIFSACLLMALGFLGGKAVGIIKLPSITGYLLIGLLIGPSVFNVVTPDNLSQLSHVVTPVVSECAPLRVVELKGSISV